MKKAILLLAGIICLCSVFFGCGGNNSETHPNDEQTAQDSVSREEESTLIDNGPFSEGENQTEDSNAVSADEAADRFGIFISLPESTNWIVNSEYHLIDENNLKITYYDSIADADCIVLAAKNENLTLPENEYDDTLIESWEGRTITDQKIVVKVQYGKNDGKTVLVTWEYKEYQFAIIGEAGESAESIPKTALNIINNLN